MGVPELDAQHRELFARIDRLLDAMLRNDRSEAVRLLAFLRDYVVIHFEAEAGYMADTSYPDAQRHLEEHRRFAATLHELDEEFFESGTSAGRVLRLEQLVVAWLHDHVYFTDVAHGAPRGLPGGPGVLASQARWPTS
jgi:hemerythrin